MEAVNKERMFMRQFSGLVRGITTGWIVLTMFAGLKQTAFGNPADPLKPQQIAAYRQVAARVWKHMEALSERYPHLRTIKSAAHKTDAPERLWIAYHYAQAVSNGPTPDYKPGIKVAPTIKVFAPEDGVEMDLYFYEGTWPGQGIVSPLSIGDMNVVVFISGHETKQLESLREAVGVIIRDEKARFDKERH